MTLGSVTWPLLRRAGYPKDEGGAFLDKRDRMGPRKIGEALVGGARGVLPIAATTAAAGIIVAVVSLTGLGLELSSLIVDARAARWR